MLGNSFVGFCQKVKAFSGDGLAIKDALVGIYRLRMMMRALVSAFVDNAKIPKDCEHLASLIPAVNVALYRRKIVVPQGEFVVPQGISAPSTPQAADVAIVPQMLSPVSVSSVSSGIPSPDRGKAIPQFMWTVRGRRARAKRLQPS